MDSCYPPLLLLPSKLIALAICNLSRYSPSPRSVMGIPNPPFGTHRRRERIRYLSGFLLVPCD